MSKKKKNNDVFSWLAPPLTAMLPGQKVKKKVVNF